MSDAEKPKLGIIAGGGLAPRRIIEACRAKRRDFLVICLEGQADKDLATGVPHLWISLSAFMKLRDIVRDEKIGEIVMIGRVRRPSLKELRPGWSAVKILAKVGLHLGDDSLLRSIGKVMEEECGVRVIGVQDILGGLLMREGKLGAHAPDADAEKDIARGMAVAKELGRLDVGQAVIVQQGLVLGVEGIEGTDALMARCKGLHREGKGGVLVKCAKPQQDSRFDLPAIGPDTIEAAAKAGLRGIAIEAERALVIDRDRVRELADEKGLFVVGVHDLLI